MAQYTITNVNEFVDLFTGKLDTEYEITTSNPWEIELVADIDMNDIEDNDIERVEYKINFLPNTKICYFNGNNHTISNISYQGVQRFILFNCYKGSRSGSVIKNVVIKDILLNIESADKCAIVRPLETTSQPVCAKNIQITGNITSEKAFDIINIYSDYTQYTSIEFCSFKGILTAPYGSKIFYLHYSRPVLNCFFEGKINSTDFNISNINSTSMGLFEGKIFKTYAKDTGGNSFFKFIANNTVVSESYVIYSDKIKQLLKDNNITNVNVSGLTSTTNPKSLLVVADGFDGITLNNAYSVTSEQLKDAEWLRSQGWAI